MLPEGISQEARKQTTVCCQEHRQQASPRGIHNLYPEELPSFIPLLMVDLISENSLISIQSTFSKFIKRWLNLPRCCALVAVYHPEVLQLPFIPHCRERSKLSLVSALVFASDPATKECLILLTDPEFLKRIDIPRDTCTILDSARRSISSTTKTAIKQKARVILHQCQAEFWNSTLTPLLFQSKFKDIILLETQSCTWESPSSRIACRSAVIPHLGRS